MKKSETPGTIHDAKNQILEFFNEDDDNRIDLEEVKFLKQKLKALKQFNEIIDKKREEIEEYVRARVNVKINNDILRNKKKVELNVPKNIRTLLSNDHQQLKLKEFYLKEIDEFTYKNYINFHTGKKFDFILDTGFKKHKISYDKLKEDSVLSEKNLINILLDIYKKDVDEGYENDKKTNTKQEFKKKQNVYNKIYKVLEHNKNIASDKSYTRPLFSRNEKGDYIRSAGEYPMMFDIRDYVLEIWVS